MSLDLDELRFELDELDRDLVALYQKRMNICAKVAQYKIMNNKDILDVKREKEKIASVKGLVSGEYEGFAVEQLYKQIMTASRRYQYHLMGEKKPLKSDVFKEVDILPKTKDKSAKLIYQGIAGSYSNQASVAYFGNQYCLKHENTFEDTIKALIYKDFDYAILPIENSYVGSVIEVYDLLVKYDIYIVAQYIQNINHVLLANKNSDISDIKEVYSHNQALMQCRDFIRNYKFKEIECINTALAALKVKESNDISKAAIASEIAADIYDLKIIKKNIAPDENMTRFIIVSKAPIFLNKASRISLMFELKHKSGALYNILANFIFNGINMLNIESRPIKNKNWQYRFFIDIEGKLSDSNIKNALNSIKEEALNMKIFGNY